jgi:hypothetical protein
MDDTYSRYYDTVEDYLHDLELASKSYFESGEIPENLASKLSYTRIENSSLGGNTLCN